MARLVRREAFDDFATAEELADVLEELERRRPRTRADCDGIPRPCPFLACRHHLAVTITAAGGLVVDPHVPCSCALDVADEGMHTLEDVGALLGLTRERVRQIETRAIAKLQRAARRGELERPSTPPEGFDP